MSKTARRSTESAPDFAALFMAAADPFFVLDGTDILAANAAALKRFAAEEDSLAGRSITDVLDWDEAAGVSNGARALEYALARDDVTALTLQLRGTGSGGVERVIASITTAPAAGRACRLLSVRLARSLRPDQGLLEQIARGVSATTGQAFFQSLVETLAQALEADVAFVGEVDGNAVQTVAVQVDAAQAENFRYELEGTPCANVIESRPCCYPDQVAAQFPADEMLADLGIRGYAAEPLTGADGTVLGLIAVLYRREIQAPDLAMSLLAIFARRAAAELERRRYTRALEAAEERYRAFVAASGDAIWRMDFDPPIDTRLPPDEQVDAIFARGRIREHNDACLSLHALGSDTDLSKMTPAMLFGDHQVRDLVRIWIANAYQQHDYHSQVIRRDGSVRWFVSSARGTIRDLQLTRAWGVQRDATEQREIFEQLRHQSEHDALTGLANRQRLRERLELAVLSAQASGGGVALLLLDLDRFKEINDTLGHQAGDELLVQIGPRLEAVASRYSGLVARLGGDEFALLIEGVANDEELPALARNLAREVLRAMRQPLMLHDSGVEVGLSIGIALYPRHADAAGTLLRCADVAMYQAKGGVQGYAVYRAVADRHSLRRLRLLGDLGNGIRAGQLELHFQPQLRPHDQSVRALEALVRWRHPKFGLVPPDEFVGLAEAGNLIRPLTLWVLDRAAQAAASLARQGAAIPVSINVSTRMLLDGGFAAQLRAALERHGVAPAQLELEITESALIHNQRQARQSVERIAQMGLPIAIDDFGTGFSSLEFLRGLPLAALKIDQAFVSNLPESDPDCVIVETVTALGSGLGLEVIAEGVETEAQAAMLTGIGCDALQGYLIARPGPLRSLAPWLAQHLGSGVAGEPAGDRVRKS
ncbi:MAG: EAL domain-containing protein [Chromatiales bacterium]|nr:EAL domain-containing protein [Chromatiales bacterium]